MSASQWILFLSLSWTLHSGDIRTALTESAESVTKPVITYTCNQTTCTLSCKADNCSSYSWKENGEVKENKSTLVLEKSDHMGNIYVCVCSSSMTYMESDPILDKELFPEGEVKGWVAAAVIIPVIAVLLLSALAYYCFLQKAMKDGGVANKQDTAPAVGGGVANKQDIAPAVETRWDVAPDYATQSPALNHEYCVVKA